ncbi:hypothetical protein OKW42_003519 [Paraburkholderia sp. WC7.3d]
MGTSMPLACEDPPSFALTGGTRSFHFLPHVLPAGFHRIRLYGLLANPVRRANLAKVRDLLHVAPRFDPPSDDSVIQAQPTFICRHCGAPMIIIDIIARTAPIRAPPMSRGAT